MDILVEACGKFCTLPVEKAVENLASIFMPLFKYFAIISDAVDDLCKTGKKGSKKFF